MPDGKETASRAPALDSGRFLSIERRLLRFSVSGPLGFLILRFILAQILFALIFLAPGREARWPFVLPLAYAAASYLLHDLRRSGRLSDALSLGSFLIDVGACLVVLCMTEGPQSGVVYTAQVLLIMGACMGASLLQRPLLILAVTAAAGVTYALLIPAPATDFIHVDLLHLALFLLIALFSVHIADYAALIERQTAARYEEQLAWMQRLSVVGKAMAAVLHEAKTPLGTIVLSAESAAEALRAGQDPGEDLRVIREEADHAHAILQNFLDFVKPTRLDLEPLRLHEPLLKALSMTKVLLEERDVKVELTTQEDCAVRGSPRHLLQAFTNIIDNAVGAMPTGGTLFVRLEKQGDKALLRFEDTGVGMTPEAQGRLFEPFATSKAGSEGHGLGLNIVRWILQEHGGEVRIQSPGPGKAAS